jgi:RNA polymerase sigma-70 factor (ECF subfamily)
VEKHLPPVCAVESSDQEDLLARVQGGDITAGQELLAAHRGRLRQMITVRLDARLSSRLDPSDVIQEVFAEASRRLSDYARLRPVAFYPWLRRIAWERLVKLHQRHVYAEKRAVSREVWLALSDPSAQLLAERLVDSATSPSGRLVRKEMLERAQRGLLELSQRDREVLILRYLEQLSVAEIAAVLDITEGAVKLRHLRALDRLRRLLSGELNEV